MTKQHPLLKAVWFMGVLAIVILSTIPSNEYPDMGDLSDKFQHFMAYGVLSTIGMFAASTDKRRYKLLIAMVVMGTGLECVQYFLPTRSLEGLDALANSLGCLLGFGIYKIIIRIKVKK